MNFFERIKDVLENIVIVIMMITVSAIIFVLAQIMKINEFLRIKK